MYTNPLSSASVSYLVRLWASTFGATPRTALDTLARDGAESLAWDLVAVATHASRAAQATSQPAGGASWGEVVGTESYNAVCYSADNIDGWEYDTRGRDAPHRPYTVFFFDGNAITEMPDWLCRKMDK